MDLPEGELPATEAPAIPDLDPNPVPLASIKREGGVDAAGKRFLFQLGALVFFMIGAMVVGAGLHDVGPIAVAIGSGILVLSGYCGWRAWLSTKQKDTLPSLADYRDPKNIFELVGTDVQAVFVADAAAAKQGGVFSFTVWFQNCSDQRRTVRVNVESDLPNTVLPQFAGRQDGLTYTPSAQARIGPGQVVKVTIPIAVGINAKSHGSIRVLPEAEGERGNRIRHARAKLAWDGTGFGFRVMVQPSPGAAQPERAAPAWTVVWTPKPEQILSASGQARFL